jgi:DNA-binding MarR family transcriptional regulator
MYYIIVRILIIMRGNAMSKLPIMSKIGVIFLSWRRNLQKDLLPHKTTLKQHFVLKQLSSKSFLYPYQIANMLFCDRPTATVIIKNMEREKWIKRERDPENGKQFMIYITEEGQEKLKAIEEDLHAYGNHAIDPLAEFTEEEKQELSRLLDKLEHNIKNLYEK